MMHVSKINTFSHHNILNRNALDLVPDPKNRGVGFSDDVYGAHLLHAGLGHVEFVSRIEHQKVEKTLLGS